MTISPDERGRPGSDNPEAAEETRNTLTADSTVRSDIPGLTTAQAAIVAGWLDAPKQSPAAPLLGYTLEPLNGIDRAIANASEWDVANFKAAVGDRAKLPGSFLIEDVLEATGVPLDHPNRVGALTSGLAKQGVIVRVGYTKARRPSRAGGVVGVWVGAAHVGEVSG